MRSKMQPTSVTSPNLQALKPSSAGRVNGKKKENPLLTFLHKLENDGRADLEKSRNVQFHGDYDALLSKKKEKQNPSHKHSKSASMNNKSTRSTCGGSVCDDKVLMGSRSEPGVRRTPRRSYSSDDVMKMMRNAQNQTLMGRRGGRRPTIEPQRKEEEKTTMESLTIEIENFNAVDNGKRYQQSSTNLDECADDDNSVSIISVVDDEDDAAADDRNVDNNNNSIRNSSRNDSNSSNNDSHSNILLRNLPVIRRFSGDAALTRRKSFSGDVPTIKNIFDKLETDGKKHEHRTLEQKKKREEDAKRRKKEARRKKKQQELAHKRRNSVDF